MNKIFIEIFGLVDYLYKLGYFVFDDLWLCVIFILDNDIYLFIFCFYCGG